MRRLFGQGFYLQCSTLAYLAHFQLDKWFVSGAVGLTEVARYEIGSRAAQALRSLPAGGVTTLLPRAAGGAPSAQEAWETYLRMSRAAGWAAVIFLVLPVLVSPMFLFAWAGEIGDHSRWVFCFLAIALSFDLLAAPTSIFTQALGRTDMDARYALLGLSLHLGLMVTFAGSLGRNGFAAATAFGMICAQLAFMSAFHRLHGRRLRSTLQDLSHEFRPALTICAVWLVLACGVRPLVIHSRWYMAPAAMTLYVTCLMAMAVAYRERVAASSVFQRWSFSAALPTHVAPSRVA
jgi:O-antigen/teichoic acid export membrane protein